MPEHGGCLLQAARRYGFAPEHAVDLSTGINPIPWQGLAPTATSWNRLPEDDDGLLEAARLYYGAEHLLAVCGSQAAIQALPRMRSPARVGVLAPSYNEHAHCWRQGGHRLTMIYTRDSAPAVDDLDVLVVCNPNNPTGERVDPAALLAWHERLSRRGGWLVVDEAFIDVTPNASLARFANRDGLIVLRSLGKFFGLAGARVGFVLAVPELLQAIGEWVGPWTIAGPAREIAKQALTDTAWQQRTRRRLEADSARLADLLHRHGLDPAGGCALFQWICTPQADAVHEALADKAVLTRRFDSPPSLRFGLPATQAHWMRLDAVLQEVMSVQGEICPGAP